MFSQRCNGLSQWLSKKFPNQPIELTALSGDAGLRNYFRFEINGQRLIAVDAPQQFSNNYGFVAIQKALSNQNIQVPEIFYYDLEKGYFCISDLGDELFATTVNIENMAKQYKKAIDTLIPLTKTEPDSDYLLPIYDAAFIEFELSIFTEWLLAQYLSIELSQTELEQLKNIFKRLVSNALEQPQVFMHRDYHSRNIMNVDNGLAVIDFQDAVKGPITYDIVSLLKDCYIRWPEDDINSLFKYFCERIEETYKLEDIDTKTWRRWFDLMGLQRHLKAAGIFARLKLRDDKPNYIKDIPLTLSYVIDVCDNYPDLTFLSELVTNKVLPALEHVSNIKAEVAK